MFELKNHFTNYGGGVIFGSSFNQGLERQNSKQITIKAVFRPDSSAVFLVPNFGINANNGWGGGEYKSCLTAVNKPACLASLVAICQVLNAPAALVKGYFFNLYTRSAAMPTKSSKQIKSVKNSVKSKAAKIPKYSYSKEIDPNWSPEFYNYLIHVYFNTHNRNTLFELFKSGVTAEELNQLTKQAANLKDGANAQILSLLKTQTQILTTLLNIKENGNA